ncbi:PP2C family protein-serine/threonine phosphatase [Streptomyces sp. NPDC000229]|uniref:PP2C family protein-serine/threonine phosphatase n=1 Tax=Streptomyces sp. NPDC000229 TaxID=3154247 RepID=UPI00332BB6BD
MRTHASAQLIGGRTHQCDATATYTHQGARAYVLLDGIGSSDEVRDWARTTARRLARKAAMTDAETGLRSVHAVVAAERSCAAAWQIRHMPAAVAVVAVHTADELNVAWCGDSRAYLQDTATGGARRLTTDHNMRQVLLDLGREPGPYSRNQVLSYIGDTEADPEIGTTTVPARGRLLLASDGAYEPIEDACLDVADFFLNGTPQTAARTLTAAAVDKATSRADNATALVADLGPLHS